VTHGRTKQDRKHKQRETKYLHLHTPVALGSQFGEWQLYWLGGWAKNRLYYLVMLVMVLFRPWQSDDQGPSIVARILAAKRTIDLASGGNRAMNGVAMNTFTIDANNNITAFPSIEEAQAALNNSEASKVEVFSSKQDLASLMAHWPDNRPTEIWNSFAGAPPFGDLKPVEKFASLKQAAGRIWAAVQILLPTASSAPIEDQAENKENSTSKKKATTKAKAKPKAAKRSAKKPKPAAKSDKRAASKKVASELKAGSKKAEVITLMRRKQGASLPELMELTGWQQHTVRSACSATIPKTTGLRVESFKNSKGERAWRIVG
jgi:hypothetical protein